LLLRCYILGIILLPVVAVDYFKIFGYDSNGQTLEMPMVSKVQFNTFIILNLICDTHSFTFATRPYLYF